MSEHGLSPRTANHIRTLISTLYKHIIELRDNNGAQLYRCNINPIKSVKPWPKTKKKIQHLQTHKAVSAYLTEAKRLSHARHFYIFAMLALNTGQRSGNIRGLRWEDVDFENRTITFRWKWSERQQCFVRGVKGDKSAMGNDATEHVTGMNQVLKKCLEEWKRDTHWKRPTDFVVARPKDGHYLTRSTVDKANRRALRAAGLPRQKVHALRHTYATHYLEAGGSIYKLKDILNHSTITTTEMYIRQSASEKNSYTDVLNFQQTSAEIADVVSIVS
jgi:integrase